MEELTKLYICWIEDFIPLILAFILTQMPDKKMPTKKNNDSMDENSMNEQRSILRNQSKYNRIS